MKTVQNLYVHLRLVMLRTMLFTEGLFLPYFHIYRGFSVWERAQNATEVLACGEPEPKN